MSLQLGPTADFLVRQFAKQSLFKLNALTVSLKHLGFSRNRPYGIQEM